jgi:hypothetical protein
MLICTKKRALRREDAPETLRIGELLAIIQLEFVNVFHTLGIITCFPVKAPGSICYNSAIRGDRNEAARACIERKLRADQYQ